MAPSPRLANILRPIGLIWFSIRCELSCWSFIASQALLILPIVHWEAFKDAYRQHGVGAFGRVSQIRDAASAKLFSVTCKTNAKFVLNSSTDWLTPHPRAANGFIAFEDTTIIPSLLKAADGVVLELGPGPGNQLHRFDMSRVEKVYGVEPNSRYQDGINAKVQKNGLQDKYKLIVSGIEDSDVLRKEGITEGSLDSVLCIQVLCAVRDPKAVMKEIWKLLKPGGKFIFWEHGWSRSSLTVAEQSKSLITPLSRAGPDLWVSPVRAPQTWLTCEKLF